MHFKCLVRAEMGREMEIVMLDPSNIKSIPKGFAHP